MRSTTLLKFRIARFLILIFASTLLAPCMLFGADNTRAAESTLERVRHTGTIKLGYYNNAEPFSYVDAAGAPTGYAVALCQEIAKDLKSDLNLPSLSVEFVPITVQDRFQAVQEGTVDMLCGPTAETFERRKQVSFSTPIFPGGLGAMMRSDAPAQIRYLLAGEQPPYRPQWRASVGLALQQRTFSAVANTTALTWLEGKLGQFKIDAKVVPVASHQQGVESILHHHSDVFFGERSVLLDAKKRNPSAKDLIVLDRLFTYDPLAFALPREDEDFRLFIDRVLNRLTQSGETQSLYRKFFGELDENTVTFFRLNTITE